MLFLTMDDVSKKIKELDNLKKKLKSEFIGLDEVIERTVSSLTTWYVYRDFFKLPYPICIWGPTGTGKTQMAKRITELLKLNTSYIDTRDLEKNGLITLNRYFDAVILDEFQNCGSKEEDGSFDRDTKNKSKLIWSFLSEGDAQYSEREILMDINYRVNRFLLVYLEKNPDFILSPDKQGEQLRLFIQVIDDIRKLIQDDFSSLFIKSRSKIIFTPIKTKQEALSFIGFLRYLDISAHEEQSTMTLEELMNKPAGTSSLRNHVAYLKKIENCNPVVFVLGNLDSIYKDFLNNINISDEIKSKILNFSNNDLMDELSKIFFPEEISRLGKNQILFPVLTAKEYSKILDIKIKETTSKLKKSGILIDISKKLKDFVCLELIDPCLGVRGIDSSYKSLFESPILEAVLNFRLNNSVKKGSVFKLDLIDKRTVRITNGKSQSKVEIPKFNFQDELHPEAIQKRIATHEAGHALVYYIFNKECPRYIRTKLASSEVGGFVSFAEKKEIPTKQALLNQIAVCYAGLVAEELVYGKDNVSSGAYSDLKKASKTAVSMVYSLGMGDSLASVDLRENAANLRTLESKYDIQVEKILQEAKIKAQKVLKDNSPIFKKLCNKLSTTTFLSEKEFKELVK